MFETIELRWDKRTVMLGITKETLILQYRTSKVEISDVTESKRIWSEWMDVPIHESTE